MSRIVRCPSCLSTIFDSASHCHHCGHAQQATRPPRLLGRGSWAVIAVVLVVFTVVDTIELLQIRRSRHQTHATGAVAAREFVSAFLREDDRAVKRARRPGKALEQRIQHERQAIASFLPGRRGTVHSVDVRHHDTTRLHPDAAECGRVCEVPCRRYLFTAVVRREGEAFDVHGQVCIEGLQDRGSVRCFHVDSVFRREPFDPAIEDTSGQPPLQLVLQRPDESPAGDHEPLEGIVAYHHR